MQAVLELVLHIVAVLVLLSLLASRMLVVGELANIGSVSTVHTQADVSALDGLLQRRDGGGEARGLDGRVKKV